MNDFAEALSRLTTVTAASSRLDWLSILRRPLPQPGKRQDRFNPSEVVLCLAAMLVVNHHRFGGSSAHMAPTPVPQLARVFRRSPSSILAKMANLDGSRTHGGRAELHAASILLDAGAVGLIESYRRILGAARTEGIDADELPDFLGSETTPLMMLGQEELSDAEIEAAVAAKVEVLCSNNGLAEKVTERLLVAVARVGQHVFARDVLANCGHSCVFCGLQPGPSLRGRGLLRASHIKPWRVSTSKERLSVSNGLSACPDHDVAFDSGLIFLDDDLAVRLGAELRRGVEADHRMREMFGQPPICDRLILPAGSIEPSTELVRWHREHVAAA